LAGWYIGGIMFIGLAVVVAGLLAATRPDMLALGLFVGLAVVAELFQIKVYQYTTVSVSVAVNFAAALIAGLPGVAAVSAAIVLVHYFRIRPRWYKTGFNWATHVLAGLAPVLIVRILGLPLTLTNLLLLLVPMSVAALLYYALDTGLIAVAIGLSAGINPSAAWREQFRWLIEHYLVLCVMGLFLAVAYVVLGPLGLLVFALPVFMMRYTQKQYVERTEESVQELRRMNEELAHANREVVGASNAIRQLNDELFQTLAKILDVRDPYVHGHASKVADYATAIALEMGLPTGRVEQLRQAAFLHDIGKIGIPEQVLHKPEPLTAEEREVVKSHAAMGAGFLETSQGLRRLAPFVKYHHEWWDGGGYPEGLVGEQAPLEARILAVSDAVEAMASDRPYHQAMSLDEIVAELQRGAGSQFDPTVVAGFVRVAERNGRELVVNSAREVARRQAAA
jgi:putative nucleotidyltransferase with HDIG domain